MALLDSSLTESFLIFIGYVDNVAKNDSLC